MVYHYFKDFGLSASPGKLEILMNTEMPNFPKHQSIPCFQPSPKSEPFLTNPKFPKFPGYPTALAFPLFKIKP
jgi:hypothetical protein